MVCTFYLHVRPLPLCFFERSKSFRFIAISPTASNTIESIKEYARSLLVTFPDSKKVDEEERIYVNGFHGVEEGSFGNGMEVPRSATDQMAKEKEAEGGLSGCREAVEILTRNPKKGNVSQKKKRIVADFPLPSVKLRTTSTKMV